MDQELYKKLMVKRSNPSQRYVEWRTFLEVCERHLKLHNIKNPVAVELGIFKGRQKRYYEQLLGAEHIGVSINTKYVVPDIQGNTHDNSTKEALKKKLNGRPINILFIDAMHGYEHVKQDFEMYSPLCPDIVGFHDIESGRYYVGTRSEDGVFKFWDELRTARYPEKEDTTNWLFMSCHQCHFAESKRRGLGIGIIIKR